MKVKCIRLLNAYGEDVEFSSSLTLGKIYYVMGVSVGKNEEINYQIIKNTYENGWVAMRYHSSKCFEIVSDIIPSNWKIKILKMSSISIRPAAWQEPGFLERLYDANPEAQKIFERERDLIIKEDP